MAVAVKVGGEVAVAHDDGVGELSVELLQERAHGGALGFGARVAGLSFGIQSAFIADANRVLVMILAVGSHL